MADVFLNRTDSEIDAGLEKAIDLLQTSGVGVIVNANRALIANGNGKIESSIVTSTELQTLSGVTSGIQGQINNKANNNNPTFTGQMSIGNNVSSNFPNAQFISSNGDTGHSYNGILGVTGQAVSTEFLSSTGVGGNAKTVGVNDARGVVGVANVSLSADTASAIGVYGRSQSTHVGGANIAVLADAVGGQTNYSFQGTNGKILNKDNLIVGDLTNNVTLDSSVGVKLNGTSTVWKDLAPEQLFPGLGNTATALTEYSSGLIAYEFVGTDATRILQGSFEMDHDYKEGSDIYFHVHMYIPTGASTLKTVNLILEYTWDNIDNSSPLGAITTNSVSQSITIPANSDIYRNYMATFSPALSGAGKTIGSVLSFKLTRIGLQSPDTFPSSVWIKSVGVHYEVDTMGSATATSKIVV